MANVAFKKGLLNMLPSTYAEGTFYITTDERAIYLDVNNETRIRLGDFQEFADIAALEANTNPSTSALYYVTDINCLAKWDGTQYVQINRDTGATSFEVVGDGNAVTSVSYNAATRKLTLTKGETFATKAYVGTIPSEYTETNVIAYINKKAQETLDAASGGSTESAASVLAALNTYKSETDPRLEALEAVDHEHANKALLDTYTQTEANLADAVAKKHEHANAAELAKIADGDKAKWDKAVTDLADEITRAKAAETAASNAAAAADDKAVAAQGAVDALAGKVGTVTEGKTVVEMIADAQEAATYDDTALAGRVTSAEGKLTTLIGSVEGDDAKSVRAISAEEVAKIVADAPEAYDTLKEISDWISNHSDDAAAMNSSILALEAIVDGIGGEGEKATVVAYVTDAIAALNIGDYAKAADLTALAARVTTAEGKLTTLQGDENTAGSVNKALKDAKAYTDEKDTAMDARVDVLEAASHTHANADELDKIVAGDKAKWDAAQANAEATAATALSAAKTELEGKITAEETRATAAEAQALTDAKAYAKEYADGLAGNYDASGAAEQALTDAKEYVDGKISWGTF